MKLNLLYGLFIVYCLILNVGKSNSTTTALPNYKSALTDTFKSYLPIVIINTNNQTIVNEPKIRASMGVIMNGVGQLNHYTDPWNNYSGYIGIEIRGQSSSWGEMLKKSYGIETRNHDSTNRNAPIMGLPSENDWVLIASYSDKSLIRNPLAYLLANKMGLYGTRTQFCEVFINSDYKGVYMFGEKIKVDKNRVNITKLLPTDSIGDALTGGYIIKIDKGFEKDFMNIPINGWISKYATYSRKTEFIYHYPEVNDLTAIQKKYIKNYVDNFETNLKGTSYADYYKGYRKYIDVQSFIRYYLFSEVVKNIDAYRISTYIYKNRDSQGGKLTMGPVWDYDIALGNSKDMNGFGTSGWVRDSVPVWDSWQIPFWWNRLLSDTVYKNEMKCTWDTLRQTVLSDSAVMRAADSLVNTIGIAANRNFSQWPILGKYVWPNYYYENQTYDSEIIYVKDWLRGRLAWLSENLPGTCRPFTPPPPPIVPIPVALKQNIYSNINVQLQPVPFVEYLTVIGNNFKLGTYNIILTNIAGRLVYKAITEVNADGYLYYKLETGNLIPGVYFILIVQNGKIVYNGKVIK